MEAELGKIWQIAALDNLELLTGAYVKQVFPWHFHDTYCICVMEQGIETMDFKDQKVFVPAGSILVVNPFEVHSNYSGVSSGWQYRNFYASADHLQYAAACAGKIAHSTIYFPNKVIKDPLLYRYITQVHTLLEVEGFTKKNEKLLFSALGELVHKYAVPGPDTAEAVRKQRFSEVLTFMDHQAHRKVSIEEMCRVAGLSRFHFMREFERTTGLSPIAYLTQKRIERAKALLKQDVPLVEVALETGFFDQSHFSKYFKKLVGTTPSQYVSYGQ